MIFKKHGIYFLSALLILLPACNITRAVGEGEYLLHKNKIEVNTTQTGLKNSGISTDEFNGLIQQKPNRRFLGFIRFGVWVNSVTSKGKQTRFKRWLNKNLGKEPEILDSFQVNRSNELMELHLNNSGFFNSTVDASIITRKKKATVNYIINLARPYRISEIILKVSDTAVQKLIEADSINTLIKKGNIYNASLLDNERYRLSSVLRNQGYFYFSPDYIFYEIDSAFSDFTLKVYKNIENVVVPSDTNPSVNVSVNHEKYYLNRIFINPDFNPLRTDTTNMSVKIISAEDSTIGNYSVFYRERLKIRPIVLSDAVFLEPSKLYREIDERNTYRQLSGFPLFGFTSISFRRALGISDPAFPNRKFINANIELTRRPVQSFTIETEGTNSGGRLGTAGNFVYQNLNIFKGGEVLSLKLTGGVEWQAGSVQDEPVLLFFNTVQTGAELSLEFPKFLVPAFQSRIPKTIRPITAIRTGINYQNRPDYERYVTNLSFGYNWRTRNYVSNSFIPIEINSVSIFPDSAFIERLENLNDNRLINQYTDHLIMAAKYTYTFNNQQRNKVANFTYFRWNIETAGNVLNLFSSLTGAVKNENNEYLTWNIPFAQYARTNIDFRYYLALDKNNTLVYRALMGIGIPYGNSSVLPFEKGFYAGGSSDMRGWNYRSLGPGSYSGSESVNFEKMGDLILQTNLEYRFPIYSWFKGALFVDAGNIWLLDESENYPGGKFDFERFLSEMAIDAGIGLRLDFNFFIFRIDAAAPFKDPSLPGGKRWRLVDMSIKKVIWNFGIGYPF
jgi:outer membrane protein assembly factor BamA